MAIAEIKNLGFTSIQRAIKYIRAGFLILVLSLLFSFQNFVFNSWLGIDQNPYFLRQVLVTFALGLILYSPFLFFRKRGGYIYLLIISFLVSFIFISQFLYYGYSQDFLQISVVKYASQIFSVGGTIKTLLNFQLLFFLISVFVVIAAWVISRVKNYKEIDLTVLEKIICLLVIILFAWFSYNYLFKTETAEWGDASRLYKDSYDLNTLVGKVGVVNFSVEDAVRYFLKFNSVTAEDKKFLAQWATGKNKNSNPATASENYFGVAKGRNLIIIQVESLENAVINKYISGSEISPNLNQLAKQGLYFSNYYTQVFSGNTADAEFATMDSLYPLPDDVVFIDYAQNKYNALPKNLKKSGYGTYVMHGDVPSFWNRSNIYPGLGYSKAFDLDDYTVTRPVGEGPSDLGDEDLFLQSLPKLEKLKSPFMATVITMSSHTPFILPDDLQTLNISSETNLNQTQWEYLQSIHYADKAIGEFIDGLKKDGLYNDSIIVIYGDHQSYTNIWQPLGTGVNDLPGLANSHIPLIIIAPSLSPKVITTPASHLDLFPTLDNLLGIIAPKTILGQDILNTKTPVVVKRNSGSGYINTILTNSLAFEENKDGIFENGTCLQMPEKKSLTVLECSSLYNQQADTVRASDIIIRGDLLNVLNGK